MDKIEWERLRFEHVWRHFQLHAQQRSANFNHSVLIAAAIYVMVAISVQYSLAALTLWSCVLGLLAMGVFWAIDYRNRSLVQSAEAALKELEANQIAVPGVFFADIFTKTGASRHPSVMYAEAHTVFYVANIIALAVLAFGGYFGFFELLGI